MTEHESTAEFLTPQGIIDRYMACPPNIAFGQIDHEQLREWHEQLSDVSDDELDPEQQHIAAWLTVEYAFARRFAGDGVAGPEPSQLFDEAIDQFSAIANHESPQITGLMRGQALVGLGSALVWNRMAEGKNINAVGERFLSLQGQAARHIVEHGKTTGSARAAMWADTLTLVMLGWQDVKDDLVFPASPRHTSPDVDGFYRSNGILISREAGAVHMLRVAGHGPEHMILITPELLAHSGYPSASGYGTLESLIALQTILDEGASKSDAIRKKQLGLFNKAHAHQTSVTAAYQERILLEKQRLASGIVESGVVPADPQEWYNTLPPSRHPYVVDRDMLDAAISPLELRHLDEGGLPPVQAMDLAWMYAEVALGRAAQPTSRAENIRGDIQRGEEIFGHAMERLNAVEDSLTFCESSFGFASLAMYEAVLCGDDITPEMAGTYCEAMVHIGRRAIARYHTLANKQSPEAQELDALVQRLTLCLLVHLEGEGAYVALPATPRQQGPGGWDVTIWSQTLAGFVPGRYGRLRVAEKEDRSPLSDGIVIVTPQHLNQKMQSKRFETFSALADTFHDEPLPPKAPTARAKQVGKAWAKTTVAIEAAEV